MYFTFISLLLNFKYENYYFDPFFFIIRKMYGCSKEYTCFMYKYKKLLGYYLNEYIYY